MGVTDSRPATALLMLMLLAVQGPVGGQVPPPRRGASKAAPVAERVRRIEEGLLPAVAIKGEPPVRMKLAERMAYYKVPAVSIAVIDGFKTEWARGYGVGGPAGANPVDQHTLFQAASLSKPVTAAGVLRLVEKGKLTLDEDVNGKLLSWKVPDSELTREKRVTLRGILSHTAGLTTSGFVGYSPGETLPTLRQVLDGQKPANSPPVRVAAAPGTKMIYSGGGYVALQQLIEDVTRTPFERYMRQEVLQRAGMRDSTFEQPLPPALLSRAATGHLPDGKEMDGGWNIYVEQGPAGLWSTPSDLARFAIEVMLSRSGKSNRILSRSMAEQMLTPQLENSGLGLFVDGQGPSRRFTHSGSNVGYKSYMIAYLESGRGAVVMTNGENGAQLVTEILRSIAAEYGWPDYRPREKAVVPVDPRALDSYVGRYELAPGAVLVVGREGDRLTVQGPGQPKAELLAESATVFFVREVDAQYTFVGDEGGKVTRLVVRRGGREFPARRIE